MAPVNTHRQRMETCLSGKKPDRVPVALWRHFPVDDQNANDLAAATIQFQQTFDFDFVKVSPSSSYCLVDWGIQDKWTGDPEGSRQYTHAIVHHPDDWLGLAPLNPHKGRLGEQLRCLQTLVKEFSPHTPLIQTVFSPLTQARHFVNNEADLLTHLRQNPDALHAGLRKITETTLRFVEEAVKTGIDGIYFAVQMARYPLLTPDEFEIFGKAYDMQVLEACNSLWLNLVHIHGNAIMFDQVASYPAAILNWHDRSTPPSLGEGQKRFGGTVCGGLRQWDTLVLGTPADVRAEAREAIEETGGKHFILGTGCVTPVTAPYGNLRAAVECVR